MKFAAAWLRALRLPAQINLALPLLVGMAHGAPNTRWHEWPLLTALVLSLLLQAMILFSNDAADGAQDDPEQSTVISGGSGVVADGLLSPAQLRRGAIVAGIAGGLLCLTVGGTALLALWMVAALLVWLYDGPLRLSHHPSSSLCQAVGLGIVTPLMGAWLAAPPQWLGWRITMTALCLGFASHLITALPDRLSDEKHGKRTVAVWLGERHCFALLLAVLLVAASLLIWSQPIWLAIIGVLLISMWHMQRPTRPAIIGAHLWLAAVLTLLLWVALGAESAHGTL